MYWRPVLLITALTVTLAAGSGCAKARFFHDLDSPYEKMNDYGKMYDFEKNPNFQQNDLVVSYKNTHDDRFIAVRRSDGTWIAFTAEGKIRCCYSDEEAERTVNKSFGYFDTSHRGEDFDSLVKKLQAEVK